MRKNICFNLENVMNIEELEKQYHETAKSLWMMTQQGGLESFDRYKERFMKQCPFDKYCEMKQREEKHNIITEPYNRPKTHMGNRMVVTEYPGKIKNKKHRSKTEFLHNKPIVLKRDNYKCTECGSTNRLEIHHIIQRSNGGSDEINNLITLCLKCHIKRQKGQPVQNLMFKKMINI